MEIKINIGIINKTIIKANTLNITNCSVKIKMFFCNNLMDFVVT